MKDIIHIDPALLAKWNRPAPRYTSYPTAPQFHEMGSELYSDKLHAFDRSDKPLSLYFHIPFCKTMCLFCGCSVVLNRNPVRQSDYFEHLLKEIELVTAHFSQRRLVTQLHLGGGTPTSLNLAQFDALFAKIHRHFILAPDAEISIEIDPRTVYADNGEKLTALKRLGFNRVSFGVQDLDPKVQEAVRRRQTEKMTVETYTKARELGFDGVNIDLIYGLPFQTVESFSKTADKLIELKPDRIAFYSYAKIPWIKEHQKAIPDSTLPTTDEKFRIYVDARARFMNGGYDAIGMDHFALPTDPMARAYHAKTLMRNFQGYSVKLAEDMIGFGLTAIGFIENGYFQNLKELKDYQTQISQGRLPLHCGYILNADDILRRQVIQQIMCHFEIDKCYGYLADIEPLKKDGLLEESVDKLIATPIGRLFIRLIAYAFDAYANKGQFSRAV